MKQSKIYNLQSTIYNRRDAAFTLVELMIVVAILGIMAAIVLPEFQSHTQQAKEAAAKDNLRILRDTIERYAAQHNDVAPGYPGNDKTLAPMFVFFNDHLITGSVKYLSELPPNPISGKNNIYLLSNDKTLDEATANTVSTGIYGWIYHPASKTVKLNCRGTDSEGKKYFDY